MRDMMQKHSFGATVVSLLLVIAMLTLGSCSQKEYLYGSDFGIETVVSPVDFNENGNDDYTDFLLGARADAENHPVYDSAYREDGYPPENIGVCADVIWRAFKEAGYSLRDMIDNDIAENSISYSSIRVPDSNIDFRRVVNLKVFFSRHAISLTTDVNDIVEWQPGDIVIFGNNTHIGIVSDRRNKAGQPYIIHNGGQDEREQDYITKDTVTAHFRFDASLLSEEVLCAWESD